MAPNELSAAAAARLLASRELSCEDLVSACLERIAEREGAVGAWAFVEREAALERARAADRSPKAPLYGLPFGIKDVIDTAELPTEYNSPIWKGHRPKADAACVALLKHAGGVLLGKTETTEFANNHPARTRNPHNGAHTPGGSSSGSAASVADRMVPFALGTQTGGSVIRPAAFCGVAAIKPSFGSINRAGLKFVSESLDTIGVFARTAEDLEFLTSIISSREILKAIPQKPKIGLCRTPRWSLADKASQKNLEEAAKKLERAGAKLRDFELPAGSEALFDRHKLIMGYESARALAWEYYNHPAKISPTLKPRLDEGWKVTREEYDDMRETARLLRRATAERMKEVDLLLTPSATGEAPASLASTGDPVFNRAWTLLGLPCVTLPYGRGTKGLPLGVQLVGAFDADMALLARARWCEAALAG